MRSTWLVRAYPRRWRERYEAEFAALLDEEPATPRLVLDVLAGAVRAHREPVPTAEEVAMSRPRISNTLALAAIVAVLPAALFFVAAILRLLQPTQYQPAAAADQVFQAFAGLPSAALVALLLVGPGLAIALGAFVAGRRVAGDAELRADLRALGQVCARLLRRPAFVLSVLAAVAGLAILAAVTVHAIAG